MKKTDAYAGKYWFRFAIESALSGVVNPLVKTIIFGIAKIHCPLP
jgi:hypothetical protein